MTREFVYMADCAGLSLSTTISTDNVAFSWSGYNSSLPVFIKETFQIYDRMKTMDLTLIFKDKKEELLQQYKNHYLQQTFRLAWG